MAASDLHAKNEASFRQRVLGNVCQYDFVLYWVLLIEIVLILFAVLSYPFGDPDRATEMILLIDFVLLALVTAATVGIIRCAGVVTDRCDTPGRSNGDVPPLDEFTASAIPGVVSRSRKRIPPRPRSVDYSRTVFRRRASKI